MTTLVLALATTVLQPSPADRVSGEVFAHDGTRVAGAALTLTCGPWKRDAQTAPDGSFAFDDVPAEDCTLRIRSAAADAEGVSERLPAGRREPVAVILPRPLRRRDPTPPGAAPDTLDLVAGSRTRGPDTGNRWQIRGTGLWISTGGAPGSGGGLTRAPGLLANPVLPSDNEQGWTAGVRASRAGPWGTLFTGAARVRRQANATTLLSDVTETAWTGGGAWSLLADPTRTAAIWDLRLGVERSFGVGAASITLFGEVYGSLQPRIDGGALPAGAAGPGAARSGKAVRGGVRIGF